MSGQYQIVINHGLPTMRYDIAEMLFTVALNTIKKHFFQLFQNMYHEYGEVYNNLMSS